MEKFKNAKIITSCGTTGIFIDGVLNEDFDVTNLDKIKSMIDNTFEVEYTHHDGSIKDVLIFPNFGLIFQDIEPLKYFLTLKTYKNMQQIQKRHEPN